MLLYRHLVSNIPRNQCKSWTIDAMIKLGVRFGSTAQKVWKLFLQVSKSFIHKIIWLVIVFILLLTLTLFLSPALVCLTLQINSILLFVRCLPPVYRWSYQRSTWTSPISIVKSQIVWCICHFALCSFQHFAMLLAWTLA